MEAVPLAFILGGGGEWGERLWKQFHWQLTYSGWGVGGEAVEVGTLPINLGGVGYYCRNNSTFEGWGGVGVLLQK